MTVQTLIDYVNAVQKISKPLAKYRLNFYIRHILRGALIWRDTLEIALSTSDTEEAKPAYVLKTIKLWLKNADNVVYEPDPVDLIEISSADISGEQAATAYAETPTLYKFDKTADQNYTIYLDCYRTLAADLDYSDDIQTTIPMFLDMYNEYLKNLLIESAKGTSEAEIKLLLDSYVKDIRQDHLEDYNRSYLMESRW